MAKPELDDGFTRIANEILGALSRINLSAYETSVLLFIFRNTYGWQRKEDLLGLKFIAEGTAIRREHVCRTLRSLREKKMIVARKDRRGYSIYGFQKDYERWAVAWRGNEAYQGVTSGGNEPLPKEATVAISGMNHAQLVKDRASLGTQQRKKKESKKENHHDKKGHPLPKEVIERKKTIAAFVKLYVPSPPGVEMPYRDYPSSPILDDVDLLASLWGDREVRDAIATAASAGKTRVGPNYLSAILKRWHKEGKIQPKMTEREYDHYEQTR